MSRPLVYKLEVFQNEDGSFDAWVTDHDGMERHAVMRTSRAMLAVLLPDLVRRGATRVRRVQQA